VLVGLSLWYMGDEPVRVVLDPSFNYAGGCRVKAAWLIRSDPSQATNQKQTHVDGELTSTKYRFRSAQRERAAARTTCRGVSGGGRVPFGGVQRTPHRAKQACSDAQTRTVHQARLTSDHPRSLPFIPS
jgi:hypothetical protein